MTEEEESLAQEEESLQKEIEEEERKSIDVEVERHTAEVAADIETTDDELAVQVRKTLFFSSVEFPDQLLGWLWPIRELEPAPPPLKKSRVAQKFLPDLPPPPMRTAMASIPYLPVLLIRALFQYLIIL